MSHHVVKKMEGLGVTENFLLYSVFYLDLNLNVVTEYLRMQMTEKRHFQEFLIGIATEGATLGKYSS
jgi:hypothetical protein